jgi:RNA polymerase sigma-70 factor (ECF subfamily)
MSFAEDNELYLKLKEGDEKAFEVLFRKYYAALCSYANQFLFEKSLSEEVVQDMFLKIWEKRAVLTIEMSLKHYVFRSVRNRCLNLIQHEKVKKQYAGMVLENSAHEISPDEYFLEVDLVRRIEKSIESLPPKRREIFKLSREQGLKYKEIADSLGISVKTVEVQMGLALKQLREQLKDYTEHIITLFFTLKKIAEER